MTSTRGHGASGAAVATSHPRSLARAAAQGISVSLPYPPAANRLWRNVTIRGHARTLLSREGRAYQLEAGARLRGLVPIEGPVRVELRVYRPRRAGDLDGRVKAVLDVLQGAAYINDSQVVELHAYRLDDKHNPRVEVAVARV